VTTEYAVVLIQLNWTQLTVVTCDRIN